MIVAAWLVLLGLLAAYFNDVQQRQINPNNNPNSQQLNGQQVLTLDANKYKHFVMTGKINGQKIAMLLDTGATQVAIPAKMGKKLGLKAGAAGLAATANGHVTVFHTRIDKLELGDIVLYNVPAELNPGMDHMDEVLLGMSALSQLEFSQQNGKLEIRQ